MHGSSNGNRGTWGGAPLPDVPRASHSTDTGRLGVLNEYRQLRNLLRHQVPKWYPLKSRVTLPRQYGGTTGTVCGYHSAEVDAVWVQLDVPPGDESRRALVLAEHLSGLSE